MKKFSGIIIIFCCGFFFSGKSIVNAQTTTFNYTGGVQTYVVPPCATQITVTVSGAQGGLGQGRFKHRGATDVGGEGGSVTGVLNVTAGTTIDIFVGGQGTAGTSSSEGIGGYNGGGNGYYYYYAPYNQGGGGGGGGGASDIRVSPYALANRVVVAGGGGGGGFNTFANNYEQGGAGGASTGGEGYASGVPGTDTAGAGGTQSGGGLGGTYTGYCTATSGTLGNGGSDCTSSANSGAGGGGGYYGGGGGVWAGGGGGSNYTGGLFSVTSNLQGVQSGNGVVTITPNGGGATLTFTPSQTNPTCTNSNGSAGVTPAGGTSPYTYSWNPSGQTNQTATGLSAGTYTVTVHDICGDVGTTSITLVAIIPVVNASPNTEVLCNGGSTGSASSAVTGGATPYTYSWSSGGTNPTVSGLSAGTYTLTVHDNNGCAVTASVSITQPNALSVSANLGNNVLCNGGNTGSASSTVSGGTTPYTYSWSSGGTNPTVSGLSAGSYTLTVHDNNGCSGTASVSITQPNSLSVAANTSTNVLCNGGSTGSASSTISGGTTPYTYSWSSGGTNPTVSGLSAGSYTLTVHDNNGCSGTASVSISQPTSLSVSANTTANETCNGGNTGSASSTVSGGTNPYTYSWSSGGTNPTVSGLTAGSFTLTVTDNNGCTGTASVSISQPPAIAVTTTVTAATCTVGGTATVNSVTNGTSPYTYLWTGGQTNITATGLSAGSYTVNVTDKNGCTGSASATVTQAPGLVVTAGTTTNETCAGGNTGSTWSVVTGGTTPYTYSWSGGGGTNANATGLTAGTYTVSVTDMNGCTGSASASVTQPPAIVVTTATTPTGCSPTGTATVNSVTNGTSPYTYLWTGGQTNVTATGLSAGSYTVNVTDKNGCTGSAAAIVTEPATLTVNASVATNETCAGGNTGSTTSSVSGGATPYTYSWTPSGGTNATASGLTAGSYTLNVTDNNGCIGSASVTITAPPALNVLTNDSNEVCNGDHNGQITAYVSGGTGAYTYSWIPGGSTGSTITGLTAGTYTLIVHDNNGCTVTTSVSITQPTLLTASITASTNVLCNGGTGNATVTAGGGTAPYTYLWAPHGGTNAMGTGLTAGSYTVTVKDKDSCTASASVTITQPGGLVITLLPTNVACNGGNTGSATSAVTGGTVPYTYSWSGGGTNSSKTGLTAGTYTLNVTDNNGCTGTASVSITQPASPIVITGHSMPTAVGGCTGSAWINAVGGTMPYTYSWTGAASTTDSISMQCSGSYCCIVTDAHGCTDSVCINIKSSAGIESIESATPEIVVYPNPNNGQFTIQSSVGSGQWSVEVYNILGEKVYSQYNIQHSTLNINIGNRPDGIYLYRVITESGKLLGKGKIILQK